MDDIKIMGLERSGVIENIKANLTVIFKMVDIRSISFYLGLKVERNQDKKIIKLSQPAYI